MMHSQELKPSRQKTSKPMPSLGQSMKSRFLVQAKLEVSNPEESNEREADWVADQIVSGGSITHRSISSLPSQSGIPIPDHLENEMFSQKNGGMAMPSKLSSEMEGIFGYDFSGVRLHTDPVANQLSKSISAKAFTHENDIFFNSGQFSPGTSEGKRLLAHELTHVVQGGGKIHRQSVPAADVDEEKVALLFHGNPRMTDEKGVQNKSHGEREYVDSANKAKEAIDSKVSPDQDLFKIPDVDRTTVVQTHTKYAFFSAIEEQKDNSIEYLGVYSHGRSDQILLGFMDFSGEKPEDIDIHVDDLIRNAAMLRSKFRSNATVELWGCNLGSGVLPVAQVLANVIGKGVRVHAYNTSSLYKKYPKNSKEYRKNKRTNLDGTFIPARKRDGIGRLEFTPKDYFELAAYLPTNYYRQVSPERAKKPIEYELLISYFGDLLEADLTDDQNSKLTSPEIIEYVNSIYEALLDAEREKCYNPH